MNDENLNSRISKLIGPILVTGAGGFVGSHLYASLLKTRNDVFGITRSKESWRLKALGVDVSIPIDLTAKNLLIEKLETLRPKTIFNLAAYGAYSHQTTPAVTYEVNIGVVETLAEWCIANNSLLIQTGSSSEYGLNCSGPLEAGVTTPNSRYAITKLAASNLLAHLAATKSLKASVVRLYSIYGPLEDPTRLIPTLIRSGLAGELPRFSPREVTRDFLYIDDAIEALVIVGVRLALDRRFEIYNLATGVATSMNDVAQLAKSVFGIDKIPVFAEKLRDWDLRNWYGNSEKIEKSLGWRYEHSFDQGLRATTSWYQTNQRKDLLETSDPNAFHVSDGQSKMLSIIIACYRDSPAIPEMHERVTKVLTTSKFDYEIIFVNDCSPDDAIDVIKKISLDDPKVLGINHARNFGSQAAFLSGMQVARGDACILMDGDLQDPPEIIASFIERWQDGFDVVYGVRKTREAPWIMQNAYKIFYRVLTAVTPFKVPRDAGDFSLISRPVINSMMAFGEREVFLRISRAYSGHMQCGVDYYRPKRAYGVSTNSFAKNIGWAIKGILAASKKPLTYLSISGALLFLLTATALILQFFVKVFFPSSAAPGAVTNILITMFFGSINLLGISILGEYIGRILEEVRGRPRFIVRSVTRNGIEECRNFVDEVVK